MTKFELNVRKERLLNCLRCSNKEIRHQHQENNGICTTVKGTDGFPLRCVGSWANDKIYYLTRYFDIFSCGMHKKWPQSIHYIEICSGPGRCSTRDGYEQDGTALAIVRHPSFNYIKDALFVDYDEKVVSILNERLKALGKAEKAHAILGDYNNFNELCKQISHNGITLCLIDPTDCSVPFETIKKINQKTNNHCDFIISFFDKIDFNRNGIMAYEKQNNSLMEKYQRFLGLSDFYKRNDVIDLIQKKANSELSRLFREEYIRQLSAIGLRFNDTVNVGSKYHLVFASNNQRGLEFWKKANKKCTPSGQTVLDL